MVERRDKGVCKSCTLDTTDVGAIGFSLYENRLADPQAWETWEKSWRPSGKVRAEKYSKQWFSKTRFWESDHIVEVRDGGGSTGLSNIQTLCLPCHRLKTKGHKK